MFHFYIIEKGYPTLNSSLDSLNKQESSQLEDSLKKGFETITMNIEPICIDTEDQNSDVSIAK